MIKKVANQAEYYKAMAAIETFLSKGVSTLTEEENAELLRISLLVKAYEDIHYPMPLLSEPDSLPEMIRLKMFEKKLRQRETAHLLGISETRLSEVLSGKRRVNIDLAKRLHGQLNIRAEYIIQKA